MRSIVAPSEDPVAVFQTCIAAVADRNLRERLAAISESIRKASTEYQIRGNEQSLYLLPPNDCTNDEIVLGEVTKSELKGVYTTHMAGKSKPARALYDSLIAGASLGRCPLCGVGQVSTLDHYLPKGRYPQLSVVPLNLIPACKDCNSGKGVAIAFCAEDQSLHPYFEDRKFAEEQWIFAEAISTSPITVRYFVRAPHQWDDVSRQRANSHFEKFELAKRFSIEAANELAAQRYTFDQVEKKNGLVSLIELLSVYAASHSRLHVNSWQTSLYQALAAHYLSLVGSAKDVTEECPVCEGEGVLVSYYCPFCEGNRFVSAHRRSTVNMSEYERLNCPECDERPRCRLCSGDGTVPRETILQLTRRRP